MNSAANCSSMWFGTTYQGWRISPSRRISIPAMTIVPVLPAPTAWSSSTDGSATIRATADNWCGRGVNAVDRPGNSKWLPVMDTGHMGVEAPVVVGDEPLGAGRVLEHPLAEPATSSSWRSFANAVSSARRVRDPVGVIRVRPRPAAD